MTGREVRVSEPHLDIAVAGSSTGEEKLQLRGKQKRPATTET